ncbi:uncharacterized protein BXZ73DRAFT_50469 [Epithele typhae]|uniref:uncharacterized protein n=1 Tax=Epithele typhae TaxID=378194 RepID=UPI002008D18C|nr:uncharacterized protein BXZ73DRAFT_50469 [Epithele typhae]KAH9924301.1 hypothetical protein BXZ73DRAFT_50469 [Epithele typhae]
MPLDLPGLYWDEEKKRYFPISSKPAGAVSRPIPPSARNDNRQRPRPRPRTHGAESDSDTPPSKRHHAGSSARTSTTWDVWNGFRESALSLQRGRSKQYAYFALHSQEEFQFMRCCSKIRAQQLSDCKLDQASAPVSLGGLAVGLCTRGPPKDKKILVGDITGWLYSIETKDPEVAMPEFGVRSQVSATTAVTSLGPPGARLLVAREDMMETWIIRVLPPKICADVWCGEAHGRKATLGGRKAALYFPDAAERDEYTRIPRTSDVLAMCQQNEHITYLGMRNGIVDRWDSRESVGKTDLLVNMTAARPPSSSNWGLASASVDYLRVVHENALLVRTMRGDLETHDLRFIRGNTPLLQFCGHPQTVDTKLGITVDPGEDFLFAGATDRKLPIWSLRTGEPLPSPVCPANDMNIQPVRVMEIVEEDDGMYIWMARGGRVNRVLLGPRGLFFSVPEPDRSTDTILSSS